MSAPADYGFFLNSLSKKQWQKLGLAKRAGVSTPLFSLYSSSSTGTAEFPDLELLAEWCRACGMSIIQLLPMNDTGFNFTPYDAASTFALEPLYLRPSKISGAKAGKFDKEIKEIQKRFPAGARRVDYGIKKAKIELFFKMFETAETGSAEFREFIKKESFWLEDYAVYKVLKEQHGEASWESWELPLKEKNEEAVRSFAETHASKILFHKWLQWQCHLQAAAAKKSCAARGVYLMGDLPFLVSRDSADVWAHQSYFKLDRLAGAPPDAFFAKGQRWGMPAYDWPKIESRGYDYLIQKIRYSQNFYDLFRIDHVVGTFRLWTIAQNEPPENGGLNGVFDPQDENLWENHGRKILSVMVESADMLPCAEDLGVVPACSNRVLEEFGIPGMDVQRWTKEWGTTFDFKAPGSYRKNSMAVVSNHDMTSLKGWWFFEAGTTDGELFKRKCAEHGIDFEAVKEKIFDLQNSLHGRLRWLNEVSDTAKLAWHLQKPEQEIRALIDLYLESYGEKEKFCAYLGIPFKTYEGEDFKIFTEQVLRKAASTASIFSLQLLQDFLSLGDITAKEDPWDFRINFPGTSGPQNWTLVMPVSLEELLKWDQTKLVREIYAVSGRH